MLDCGTAVLNRSQPRRARLGGAQQAAAQGKGRGIRKKGAVHWKIECGRRSGAAHVGVATQSRGGLGTGGWCRAGRRGSEPAGARAKIGLAAERKLGAVGRWAGGRSRDGGWGGGGRRAQMAEGWWHDNAMVGNSHEMRVRCGRRQISLGSPGWAAGAQPGSAPLRGTAGTAGGAPTGGVREAEQLVRKMGGRKRVERGRDEQRGPD